MDLILWRHAEAFDAEPGEDDMERALTPKDKSRRGAWPNGSSRCCRKAAASW